MSKADPPTTPDEEPDRGEFDDHDFNTDAHFANNTDERATPTKLIRQLKAALGGEFDLDPCSGCEPNPIAETRYTETDDGLSQPWFGCVYCNPPYSEIEDWMEKVSNEIARPDGPDLIVALIPARTSTQWFHNYATDAEMICLVEGRLTFGGADNGAPFPSALCAFGDVPDDLKELFAHRGAVYTKEKVLDDGEQARFDDLFDLDTQTSNEQTETNDPPELAYAGRGTPIKVDLDDRSLGFPSDLPSNLTGEVLSERIGDGRREVMAVDPNALTGPDEVYILLSHPENDPADVRCCVEYPGQCWTDVSLNTVETHPKDLNSDASPQSTATP